MTLAEIISQLRRCHYECEAGRLEDNEAWRELERMAAQELLDRVRDNDWPHSNQGNGPMLGFIGFIQG